MSSSVLVIDDEKSFRVIAEEALSREGYSVRTAESGAAGARAYADEPTDVVVLDRNLPDVDGVELLGRLAREAQERGVDVSGETCPHYLLYVEDDMERMGGIAKCAPPFRTALDRERLGWMLRDRRLPMVVSDHSPSTLALKQDDDFLKVWGGISGCQSTRQLLLANDELELQVIAAVTATNVASRFGLAGKGDIAPGFDADLWIADLGQEDTVRREDLLYRNPFSAHEGQRIRGRTVKTLVRGGEPDSGRFIRPAARS